MTTTESKNGLGGYEAAKQRSEQKEPPMTKTQDELMAALKASDHTLKNTVDDANENLREADLAARDWVAINTDDLRLILAALRSPDPEVERLREEIEVAAVRLQLAGGWLREAGDDGQRANTLLNASNRARAALSSNSGGR